MNEYWREQKDEVFEALDLIEDVLDDYDENVGLAFEDDINENFEKIQLFFRKIYKDKESEK